MLTLVPMLEAGPQGPQCYNASEPAATPAHRIAVLTSQKLRPFGTTIFAEMTRLANEHKAINLAQGFPDFDGPSSYIDAAVNALRSGHNQYARALGAPPLCEAIAHHVKRISGLEYNPMAEVGVYCGATEGLMATMLGMLDPGDEVILFEPFYDSYPVCVAMAQAVPKFCTLRFPDFAVDLDALEKLITPKTKLLVLNTPHNPTGKVFSRAELEGIAKLCIKHNVYVLTDEVYEQITYDGAPHVMMASIPGMRERTMSLSSVGKTFSFTGWKIGWATGPSSMITAALAAHQFITFCSTTPMQFATAHALNESPGNGYFETLRKEYATRRDFLCEVLTECGLKVAAPKGTYFVLADFTSLFDGDDVAFTKWLVTEVGVAAIPPSFFYTADKAEGQKLVRFAYCKRAETLEAAAERLRKGLKK